MSLAKVVRSFGPGAKILLTDDDASEKLIVRNISVEVNTMETPIIHMDCTLYDEASMIFAAKNRKATIPAKMKAKRVVYNPPATIVLWEDGTKTVVRCDLRDDYDPKYGLALCYMKKALGNSSRALNDVLHREEGNEKE